MNTNLENITHAKLVEALRTLVAESIGACEAIALSRDVGGPRLTGTVELDNALNQARALLRELGEAS